MTGSKFKIKQLGFKASFIVPYFNAGATIQETIDSIFNQGYTNFDIWIINDGSDDEISLNKLKELEQFNNLKIIHQQNLGPSVARNNAIRVCKSDFIVPLDADDKIAANTLVDAIKLMEEHSKIGVVYGNLQYFGNKTEIKQQQSFNIRKQLLYNQIGACAVIRRQVFEDCGLYNEELSKPGLEDWEFWLRVGQSKWLLQKMDEVHFEIRVSDSSRTFQVANKNLEWIKEYVYKKHANLLAKEYSNIFYENKMLKETPDYRIGHFLLWPYRIVKSLFK